MHAAPLAPVDEPKAIAMRSFDAYWRSWLLAGAGFGVYALASVLLGWADDPQSLKGCLWSLGMVGFGCAVPAALDVVARVRKAENAPPARRSLM